MVSLFVLISPFLPAESGPLGGTKDIEEKKMIRGAEGYLEYCTTPEDQRFEVEGIFDMLLEGEEGTLLSSETENNCMDDFSESIPASVSPSPDSGCSFAGGVWECDKPITSCFTAPELLARYSFGDELGHGSFGKVRTAWDFHTEQSVAVKEVLRKTTSSKRARSWMSLGEHPGIVQTFEVYVFKNAQCTVMEEMYMSLNEFVAFHQGDVLEELQARRIAYQLASVLYFLHSHKITHNDLKSENVMVAKPAEGEEDSFLCCPWVKVIDWDFSLKHNNMNTRIPWPKVGSNGYVPQRLVDEYMRTPVGKRSEYFVLPAMQDLYALGMIISKMIFGINYQMKLITVPSAKVPPVLAWKAEETTVPRLKFFLISFLASQVLTFLLSELEFMAIHPNILVQHPWFWASEVIIEEALEQSLESEDLRELSTWGMTTKERTAIEDELMRLKRMIAK